MPLYAVILTGSPSVVVRCSAFRDVETAIEHLGPFTTNELLFVSITKNRTILDEQYTFTRANGMFDSLKIKYSVTHHEDRDEFKLLSVHFDDLDMLFHLNNATHADLLVAAREDYRSRPKAHPHSG